MTIKTAKFDAAEHLKTPEDIAAFIDAVIEEDGDDAAFIAKALGVAARAKGMSDLAQSTGLDRASLYKALSEDGRPSFDTIVRVTRALGLRIAVEPVSQPAAA
jgi:probable addiction module antidote protein